MDWYEGPCMPSRDFFRIERKPHNSNTDHFEENEDKASNENDCIGSNNEAWSEDSYTEKSQRRL